MDSSGKDLFGNTLVGLFLGGKLVFFSVLYHTIGEISGKVKKMVKLECFSLIMDSYIPPERFPEKVHIPIGLFFGRKLDYFSVLYHSIGEISGILPEK
jgi:hypothetical protein